MKIKHSLDEMNLKTQLERAKNQTYRMSSAVLMHTGVNKAGLGDLITLFPKGSRKGKSSVTSGKRAKKEGRKSVYSVENDGREGHAPASGGYEQPGGSTAESVAENAADSTGYQKKRPGEDLSISGMQTGSCVQKISDMVRTGNREELQKAILWSEILGEPVSKKRRRRRVNQYYGNQGHAY